MDSLDETLNIDTPENVVFGYSIAGIGSRFLAAFVDTFYIVLLQVLVYGLLLLIILAFGGLPEEIEDSLVPWLVGVLGLLSSLFLWGYYIFFEVRTNGQSPGKKIAKIRVLKTDGMPITLSESVVRNLVRLIDFLPAYYALGVITMFINDQSRRLGDLAAGTLVVREPDQTVTLDALGAAQVERPSVFRPVARGLGPLQIEKLTERDLQVAEDLLGRMGSLSNASELSRRILNRLLSKMELPETTYNLSETIWLLKEIVRAGKGEIKEREEVEGIERDH